MMPSEVGFVPVTVQCESDSNSPQARYLPLYITQEMVQLTTIDYW